MTKRNEIDRSDVVGTNTLEVHIGQTSCGFINRWPRYRACDKWVGFVMECPASGFLNVDLDTEFADCCPGMGLNRKVEKQLFP